MGGGNKRLEIEEMEYMVTLQEAGLKGKRKQYKKDIGLNRGHQIEQHLKKMGGNHLSVAEWIKVFSHFGMEARRKANDVEKKLIFNSMAEFIIWYSGGNPNHNPADMFDLRQEYPGKEDPHTRKCFNPSCSLESTGMTVCEGCYSPYCSVRCQESHWHEHEDICTTFTDIVDEKSGQNEQSGSSNVEAHGCIGGDDKIKQEDTTKKEKDWLAQNLSGLFKQGNNEKKKNLCHDEKGNEGSGENSKHGVDIKSDYIPCDTSVDGCVETNTMTEDQTMKEGTGENVIKQGNPVSAKRDAKKIKKKKEKKKYIL